ncbi:MAG: flagellar basal-body rod protein FlgG [Phycisphaeraceae bacterium]|nr:flagellar basal-body rod protein FlgG [Phycisphaeraceae bacterium]
MAILALHSAATGLSAMAQDIDVIAHNIANTNTTGFKSFRSNFEDLLYEEKQQPGVENAAGDQRPAGLFVGLGTRISNTQINLSQGPAVPDDGDFSMMINGSGFFQVIAGEKTLYTRAGNFFVNSEGEIVLGHGDGRRLEPSVTVPPDATDIAISVDGRITGRVGSDPAFQEFGQVEVANFTNANGLRPLGGNLYEETEASGPAITGEPDQGSFGSIRHKMLEGSNADPVNELISLIKTQRHFEMNSQSINAANEALQVIARLGDG